MAGVTGDYDLAYADAAAQAPRLADGPDEVHRNQIARLELRKVPGLREPHGRLGEVLAADSVPGFRRRPVWVA